MRTSNSLGQKHYVGIVGPLLNQIRDKVAFPANTLNSLADEN